MKPPVRFRSHIPMIIGLCLVLLLSASRAFSQSSENLRQLEGYNIPVFFSEGSQEQAEAMAMQLDKVMAFYKERLNFEPDVTVLVLSPEDWSSHTNFPVYGMPHYTNSGKLIVASQDNDFWKSFIPPVDQLPYDLGQKVSETYSDEQGALSMRGFFELLVIHELAHAYHVQYGLTMQRQWMAELFSNIFLHTYIAEIEPALLPALTVFPQMVVSTTNKDDLRFTTLQELEANYNLIGQRYPNNYGWYQCRWHKAAGEIYDAAGVDVVKHLWQTLKDHTEPLDDVAFAALLQELVHQSVADVLFNWDM
jgi:hypothetical protein